MPLLELLETAAVLPQFLSPPDDDPLSDDTTGHPAPPVSSDALTILVVDDSPTIRRMVRAALGTLRDVTFAEADSGLRAHRSRGAR